MIKVLQIQLQKAQVRMKAQMDQHRTERSFQIGDLVFLKLQPYRQTTVAQRSTFKLAPKFFCPFKVLDVISKVAYKLDLLLEAQIHNVFHVSQLKLSYEYVGQPIPLPDKLHCNHEFEPLAILESRMVK